MKIICFILLSFVAIHTTAQDSENIPLSPPKKGTLPFEVNENIFSFNGVGLAFGMVSLSYEKLIKDGKLGIKVPMYVSLKEHNPFGPDYMGGLALNFYPSGQRKFAHFISFEGSIAVYRWKNGLDVNNVFVKESISRDVYISHGLIWNVSQNFSVTAMAGVGYGWLIRGRPWIRFKPELNLSYRF